MNRKWHQTMRLPIAIQGKSLLREFPEGELRANYQKLRWNATVSPHPNSLSYDVQLDYALNKRRPTVRILGPNLKELSKGKVIPHLFSQAKQTLCLHYHDVWKPNTLLAETIVPWTVLWTEYFEWWLATGIWFGDEVIHQGVKA